MVTITVLGIPQSKARPRFSSVGGKIRTYTPKTTASYENLIKLKAEEVFTQPLDGCVLLSIRFFLPRPQRITWKTKPMPEEYCNKRPDIDNLAKSVIDGLTGIAFHDDGQISRLHIEKKYHSGGSEPKTIIHIEQI